LGGKSEKGGGRVRNNQTPLEQITAKEERLTEGPGSRMGGQKRNLEIWVRKKTRREERSQKKVKITRNPGGKAQSEKSRVVKKKLELSRAKNNTEEEI